MTSQSSNAESYNDDPHNNLVRRALRIIGGQRRTTARERALAAFVASTKVELDEARRRASIGATGNDVPVQVTQVLRSPKGTDRVVVVYHDGMTIKALLHPIGKRNPERERAVWVCIRDTAIRQREQSS